MPQTTDTVTSSSKTKRAYRKGEPLSGTERQLASIARKRANQKEIKVFVEPDIKAMLMEMCKEEGVSQADVLQRLIKREAERAK
ncbi:replication protein [Rahnella sp. AA]|uniref:replication regulatory protein RepA n=1 Tax=Rahnella sp. AA TaxID=2057180 RepID=UPI000C33D9A5|nr:replication regulatory protein RepA [Rahnella sp. AA]PKE27583.1 replication protein [Rahnella sp. AA]